MATRKASLNKKLDNKNQPSTTNQSKPRKIEAVGSDAFYESEANTDKKIATAVTTEDIVNSDSETATSLSAIKSTPPKEAKVEKTTAKTKKPTSAKESQKTKAKKEPEQEEAEKGELVKTTVYIEAENFLALEEIQLKLKRQEKRRVTKNELFNTAVELLVKHYSD